MRIPLALIAAFAAFLMALSIAPPLAEAQRAQPRAGIESGIIKEKEPVTAAEASENGDEVSEEDAAPQPRETFDRLVIANLPPALAHAFEAVCERVGTAVGVKMTPEWFRLDLCSMEAAKPFNGQQAAEALGLEIVSDVSEVLIMAPEVNTAAKRAEARTLMIDLFWEESARLWSDMMKDASAGGASESRLKIQSLRNKVMGLGNRGKVTSTGKSRVKLQPRDIYESTGPLSNAKVAAALGVDPKVAARPMKHYGPDALRVERRTVQEQYYNEDWDYYDWQQVPRLAIFAGQGRINTTGGPTAPKIDGLLDPVMEPVVAFFNSLFGGGNNYRGRSWYDSSDNQYATEEDFVAMYFGEFVPMRTPDAERVAELEEAIAAEEDDAKYRALQVELLNESQLTHGSRKVVWGDSFAVTLRNESVDDQLEVRNAKVSLAESAARFFKSWYENNPNKSWMNGDFYDVQEHYGFSWSTFRGNGRGNYDNWYLSISAVDGTEDANGRETVVIVYTNDNYSQPKYDVRVRINVLDGTYTFPDGGVEPEVMILGRRREVKEGLELLKQNLEDVYAGSKDAPEAYDLAWVKQVFEAHEFEPIYLAAEDFTITELVPGVLRLVGANATQTTKQAVVVDTVSGLSFWETLPPGTYLGSSSSYYYE